MKGFAISAKHVAVYHRLRGGNRGIGVAHPARDDHSSLDDQLGLGAKQGRLPEHNIRQFALLDRAHMAADAVRKNKKKKEKTHKTKHPKKNETQSGIFG